MSHYTMEQVADPKIPDTKPSNGPMAMCPMAKMCMGMMDKRPSGLLLMLPGVLLIVLGALIVVEPRILLWLAAVSCVLLGTMLLMMAGFMRKMGARPRA
jgi:hypothetical protein